MLRAYLAIKRIASSGRNAEALAQVGDDFFRLVEPLGLAGLVGNFQTRHLGLAAALEQSLPVRALMLRVDALDVQRQAADFLPNLDAKRAGLELVQHQRAALLIHFLLRRWRAAHALGPGQRFLEQHHRAQHGAQGPEEESDKSFHERILGSSK